MQADIAPVNRVQTPLNLSGLQYSMLATDNDALPLSM